MYGDFEIRQTNVARNNYETQKPVKKQDDTTSAPIPLVQKDKTDNPDKPVEGYYIERTTGNKEKDDAVTPALNDDDENSKKKAPIVLDDDVDDNHDVDPNIRIHTHESLARKHSSNAVTDALNDAVYSDLNNDNDGAGAHMVEADQMLSDEGSSALNEIKNAPEGFHMYAKPAAEFSSYKISDSDTPAEKYNTAAYGLDLGGTWTNKDNSTHGAFFCSATREIDRVESSPKKQTTNADNVDTEDMSADTPDVTDPEISLSLNSTDKSTDFKGFVAVDHTFKNNDELFGYASHKHDASVGSTSNIGARYISNKFGAYIQGKVTLYSEVPTEQEIADPNNRQHSVVTNFKVGFNNEAADAYENLTPEEPAEYKQDENPENTSSQPEIAANNQTDNQNKNWEKVSNPFITSEIINNSLEEGLGYEQIFKKSTDNSAIALGYFGKGSISHQVDSEGHKSESYNLTFGGNLKYKGYVGNGILEAGAKVRDKYTIAHENIFTAQGNVSYQSQKVTAEMQAVYTNVPGSTYKAAVGRISYMPKENIKLSAEASYINWKYFEGQVNGGSVQLTAIVSLSNKKKLKAR